MDSDQERITQPRREFTDDSYMNPDPTNIKYMGRDPEIGKVEAEKRLGFMPDIESKSTKVLEEMGVSSVGLFPKGSSAVGMCVSTSDLDVTVVVPSQHIFTKQPELWRKYQEEIAKLEGVDFKVEPRLVVEKSSLGNYHPRDVGNTTIDFSILKDFKLK